MESLRALKQGIPLAPQKLVEKRSKGMHTVRFEFIVRLLRLNTQIITLSIYWEDGREFMQIPASQNVQRKLVYASEPRVSGFLMTFPCFVIRWILMPKPKSMRNWTAWSPQ